MTPAELNSLINFYCFGSTSSDGDAMFPQTDKLLVINVFKDDIAKEIAKENEDYFGMKFTKNLEAGRRAYALPDEMLNNIKSVEAKLDGITQQVLTEFDLNTYKRPTDEESILNNFSKPKFDIFNRELVLYTNTPIIDVAEGLILRAIIYPGKIANLTESDKDLAEDVDVVSPGFPRQFHELLARRVAISYKSTQDRPKVLTEKEQLYQLDLRLALNAINGMNLDRTVIQKVPRDTGENY